MKKRITASLLIKINEISRTLIIINEKIKKLLLIILLILTTSSLLRYLETNFIIELPIPESINLNELSLIEKPVLELKKFALERNKKLIVIFSDYKVITYYENFSQK